MRKITLSLFVSNQNGKTSKWKEYFLFLGFLANKNQSVSRKIRLSSRNGMRLESGKMSGGNCPRLTIACNPKQAEATHERERNVLTPRC